ncbi:MAG: hypothetical protein AAF252_04560 [Pseudomonadota bacterium]
MINALAWFGRHGRYCLIAGLGVGLLLPGLAETLRPWIGSLVALLLFVTAVRVGARHAFGTLKDLMPTLLTVGVFQMALPVAVVAALSLAGLIHWPMAIAVSLMLAAPSLTGAPNFAIMVGQDPAPGMRLLVVGTALFPVTALPVLSILDPAGGGVISALSLSLVLLAVILASVGLGFAVRHLIPHLGQAQSQNALDGCGALLLAIVVVGLMSAIGPLLRSDPWTLLLWIVAALAINFTLVAVTLRVARRAHLRTPVSTAIYAGNRNIALFLIVLPAEVAAPLMIFVGCYQIPMYLTPIFLTRLKAHDVSP